MKLLPLTIFDLPKQHFHVIRTHSKSAHVYLFTVIGQVAVDRVERVPLEGRVWEGPPAAGSRAV